jgi:hypothetical protein
MKTGSATISLQSREREVGGPCTALPLGSKTFGTCNRSTERRRPRSHPLYAVNRFSNADKHRIVAEDLPFLQETALHISPAEGIVEEIRSQVPPRWEVDAEYEVGRIRYAEPFPAAVYLEGNVTVEVFFGTPAFAQETRGIVMPLSYVSAACDYVAKVVERFKAL